MKRKSYRYLRRNKKGKKLFRRWEAWIRMVNRIKGTNTFAMNRSTKNKLLKFKTGSNSNYHKGIPLVEHLRDEEIVRLIRKFLLDIRAILTNFDIERKKKIVQALSNEVLLEIVTKNRIKILEIRDIISPSQKAYLQRNLYPPLPIHERFTVEWYDCDGEVPNNKGNFDKKNIFQKILELLF